MYSWTRIFVGWLFYVGAGRTLQRLHSPTGESLFAALNLISIRFIVRIVCASQKISPTEADHLTILSIIIVVIHYGLLKRFGHRQDRSFWLAFLFPLFLLATVKSLGLFLVGISFLAFRLSFAALEVRNGTATFPSFAAYISFALFAPTLNVGPISPLTTFQSPLPQTQGLATQAVIRVLVGLAKFLVLAPLMDQISFQKVYSENAIHPPIDLAVACIATYLKIVLSFSGFCDIAIGTAGLLGIRVKENFNQPFAARNIKDFWNRQHITLSEYMQTIVFLPLTKTLIHRLGPQSAHWAIILGITVVFSLIGLWHGLGWNFFLFGLTHAAGVTFNYLYGLGLKSLPRERLRAYQRSRTVHAVAVLLTFLFVSATFLLFANSLAEIDRILRLTQL
ncbi:MAG: hypothetical protein HYR96_07425 [Deltaproteobacteria bacterium]|nr:hypothetical protein [Deltaproteobacteria bacterium]MBI3294190.1 hypothetical protein [Deltaproteobacteria bacterium]